MLQEINGGRSYPKRSSRSMNVVRICYTAGGTAISRAATPSAKCADEYFMFVHDSF